MGSGQLQGAAADGHDWADRKDAVGTNSPVHCWPWDATTVIDMSRGYPSMTALLALLAIAGYQHRDKLAELLRNAQAKSGRSGAGGMEEGSGGALDNLGSLLGNTSVGSLLGGGLRELIDSF